MKISCFFTCCDIYPKLFIRHSLFPRDAQPSLLPVKEAVPVLSLHKASQTSNKRDDRQIKSNAKPRFELSYLHAEEARVTRASLVSRDVRMKQVLKCYTVVLSLQQLKSVGKSRHSKLKVRKLWTGWSTSRTDNPKPGAAAVGRLSEWPAQEWQNIELSTVDVKSKKCRTEGCGKQTFFGVVSGTKTVE